MEETTLYFTSFILFTVTVVSFYTLKKREVFNRLILHPVSVFNKSEYYRLVSSGFVHNNLLHLFLNLFMLFIFCSGVEESTAQSGKIPVLLIFFSSLLAGNMLPLFINRTNIRYSSAGASVAIFGCMISYLLFHPYESLLSIPPFRAVPNLYTAIGYLGILVIVSRKFNKGKVDYSIHLGGGAGGLLSTLILYPKLLSEVFT